MEPEEQLVEKLRQFMPGKSALMAKGLSKLFYEYEQKDEPAMNKWDVMDLDSVMDSTLSYQEQKGRLIEFLRSAGYYSQKEMAREEAVKRKEDERLLKQSKSEERADRLLMSQEEAKARFETALTDLLNKKDESLEKLICENIPSMKKFHDFLSLTLGESDYNKACCITGPAGIRKSFHVLSELKERKKDFVLYNSHSTPLGLYEILYKNHESVIVLDDIDSILEDQKSIGLLKAACFSASGERIVTWASTSKILNERGLPDRFVFSGKIVIIANDTRHSKKESFRAFMNRMYTHDIKLSQDERKLLVRTIFMKQDVFGLPDLEKERLLIAMESVLNFSNVSNYNLRTAFKAADIWKNGSEAQAKDLIYDLLGTDENLKAFLTIEEEGRHLSVSQRLEVWAKYTGYSRSEYFKMKSNYYKMYYAASHTQLMKDDICELIKSVE